MINREQGIVDYVTIIIGLLLAALLIGFFSADKGLFNTINFKAMMRLPCGLTYSDVKSGEKIEFPKEITGYINGCGWTRDGMSAGTAQVFDNKGFPVTVATELHISDNGTEFPLPFETWLRANYAPQTDTGQLVIRSTTGLVQIIPINF